MSALNFTVRTPAMSEPTRPLKDFVPQEDGSLKTHSVATPTSFKIRGAVAVESRKVIPVIFVPGTMGTNLRVRKDVPLPPGYPLKPGDAAWQPPNGNVSALKYARQWERRKPWERQLILNPNFVEVDDTGVLDIGSCNLEPSLMRERGWGEIFNGSYGTLLFDLQSNLNMTFSLDALNQRQIRQPWKDVMQAMQADPIHRWGVRSVEPLTESELEKYAQYQYPLYACGYNWLQSCGESAKRLEKRITDTITWWQKRHHQCDKVILITHSMGGLVGRACGKRIPDKILGIVHGVMPALGAPLAYRRLACGTECDNPANGPYDNYVAGQFANIGGRRPEDTTPVLSVAPGALELLPNQLYPRPWLHLRVVRNSGPTGPHNSTFDYLHLPNESEPNPYKLYRNMEVWYRLVNPALADPAGLYSDPKRTGGVTHQILKAIAIAEKFHYWLADYYHPATFAYYGNDKEHPSYGQIRWVAREPPVATIVPMTATNVREARFLANDPDGARTVEVEGKFVMTFAVETQDSMGDDTVPHQSASGPSGKIKQLFATQGYRHQESYQKHDTLLLTRYCIVKLVQEIEKNDPSK